MNQISIRTNKGEYIGGETIYGTVYLWICSPTSGKKIKLKIKGYEKCKWEFTKQVSRSRDDGTTEYENVTCKAKGDKTFLKAEFQLMDYGGGIPIGHYSYPFQYPLQQDLPGSFKMGGKTGSGNHDWDADVKYKVKAEIETHDGKLKDKQPLVIRSDVRSQMNQPETITKEGTVRLCCCIPRGTVTLLATLDSKVYEAGTTARVHVNVKNDSSMDIENFVLKLMQVIQLKGEDDETNQNKRTTVTNTVCESKYDGCESGDSKETVIELPLKARDGGTIEPATLGTHIQCSYHIDIEMQVNWAPDIEIHAPILLTAPNNNWWSQWAPPQWLINCQPVPIDGPCAVPQPVMKKSLQLLRNSTPEHLQPRKPTHMEECLFEMQYREGHLNTSGAFSNVPGYGPPL